MSNVSGASSSSGIVRERGRGRLVGVPKRCWCGEAIVAKNSKSEPNPCRRYFRCGYAAANKLMNDKHVFKWVDEALLDKVDSVAVQIARVEEDIKEVTTEIMKQQKVVYEAMEKELEKKMVMELEKELFERVEDAKLELKARMNRMMIVLVFGFMIMFGIFKLLG